MSFFEILGQGGGGGVSLGLYHLGETWYFLAHKL